MLRTAKHLQISDTQLQNSGCTQLYDVLMSRTWTFDLDFKVSLMSFICSVISVHVLASDHTFMN